MNKEVKTIREAGFKVIEINMENLLLLVKLCAEEERSKRINSILAKDYE